MKTVRTASSRRPIVGWAVVSRLSAPGPDELGFGCSPVAGAREQGVDAKTSDFFVESRTVPPDCGRPRIDALAGWSCRGAPTTLSPT